MRSLPLFFSTLLLALPASPARAAEDYDGCTGFIDSVPAVISTQGTWCLRKDLATAIASGDAIEVAANNVTIDCNHFKLGGLAAGDASIARGIHASSRTNTTVRRCTVRGFDIGIALQDSGTAGALVEDNRLDGNLSVGILVQGFGGSVVRRNRVHDTGGQLDADDTTGIHASAHVIDNTVDGVFTVANDAHVRGIDVSQFAPGRVVRGNRVRALAPHGSGHQAGIRVFAPRAHVVGNHVAGATDDPADIGIVNNGASAGLNRDNTVSGFFDHYQGNATDAGGNASN